MGDLGEGVSAPAGAARSARVRGTEQILSEIFADALSLPSVSLADNFFDLGVTSLMMVRVRAQIRDRLARDVPIEDLFAHPNIADLARFLEGADRAAKAVGSAQARGVRQNDLFQKLRGLAGKASR